MEQSYDLNPSALTQDKDTQAACHCFSHLPRELSSDQSSLWGISEEKGEALSQTLSTDLMRSLAFSGEH